VRITVHDGRPDLTQTVAAGQHTVGDLTIVKRYSTMTTQDRIKRRIRKMSRAERGELLSQLRAKAQRILEYGPDDYNGDNLLWAGDLLRAAGLIQRTWLRNGGKGNCAIPDCCVFDAMSQSEAEEIAAILD
jgi:hypothetical protein